VKRMWDVGKFLGNIVCYNIQKDFCNNSYIKGSRQRERRGVGKVPDVHNMFLTAAIDVLFSVNFAVVFDFMYFRFLPSKAK
jgi:hypothetical protein